MSTPYRDLLSSCRGRPPRVAMVLGSGLGGLADHLDCECAVPFHAVPALEATTVAGHDGELRLGQWAGQRLLLFVGRLHYYEGCSWRQVEEPAAMARALGADILFLTNAAGGIRDDLVPGSLMPIRDHVEWTHGFPFTQPASCSHYYSLRLLALLGLAASTVEPAAEPGSYAQVTGPCYETPAEIRALRACGADVVGMSTCREICRAHAMGLECAAVSCVTNRAAGLGTGPIHHDEVMAAGGKVRERLRGLVERFLELL